jgi:hypothetical protein
MAKRLDSVAKLEYFQPTVWELKQFMARMQAKCRNPILGLSVKMQLTFPKVGKWSPPCRNPTLGLSVKMQLTLPKVGKWSPPRLPKTQKTIWGVKSPCLGAFFISMKISWNVHVQNGLAFPIWTFAAQVMGKRRVESQTASLTPDH